MAKDPLTTAVNKAEPQPTTTPRVRPSEFGIENRGMSRAAALAEDQDDYFNEGIGRRNRATPAFANGGMADPDLRNQLSAGYWDRLRQGDPLKRSVERNTNEQGLELISKDLDKPQLMRPSSNQYMREHGYVQPYDTPKFANGGMVKHGSSTRVSCKTKHGG